MIVVEFDRELFEIKVRGQFFDHNFSEYSTLSFDDGTIISLNEDDYSLVIIKKGDAFIAKEEEEDKVYLGETIKSIVVGARYERKIK